MKNLLLFLLVLPTCFLHSQTWTNNGPFGARITSFAVDPSDSTVLYAGTYGTGIYKSSDGGNSWFLANSGLPQWNNSVVGSPTEPSWWFGDYFPVTEIAISENNPNHIYAATRGGGIAFSSDSGQNWITKNDGLPDSAYVYSIWIHPENPQKILCGLWEAEYGLYRSVNGGDSWTTVEQVYDGSENVNDVREIYHVPGQPDSIYAGLALSLYVSGDGGVNWERIYYEMGFDRLLVPNMNGLLLGIVDTGFEDNLLMQSTDGGRTWDLFPDETFWNRVSVLDMDKNGRLYVLREKETMLMVSDDGGETWDARLLISDYGTFRLDFFSLPPFVTSPHAPETIYIGSRAGLFRSKDSGKSYKLLEKGMINTYINALAVNPKKPGVAYAGGEHGLWKTEDSGQSWQRLSLMHVNAIAIDKKHPDTLYIGGDSLLRSFDGAQTFDLLMADAIITEIEVHPEFKNTIAIGFYPSSVLQSSDFGANWLTSFSGGPASFRIKDIEFSEVIDSVAYFGTDFNQDNHGLYKSVDLGASWDKKSDPGLVKSIVLSTKQQGTIYLNTPSSVKISTNGGENFSVVFDSLSNHISSLAGHRLDDNILLASTRDRGAFVLNVDKKSQMHLDGPYDPRLTRTEAFSGSDYYFATHGAGVWLGQNIVSSAANLQKPAFLPKSFEIVQSYPNPFNATTAIVLKTDRNVILEATIFNILGKEVFRFGKKQYTAGAHRLVWNGINNNGKEVSSGIYTIVLTNGRHSTSRKLVLIK